MPKQSLKISSFHNGLNSKIDPRDIKDDELAILENVSVDELGRITMSGNKSNIGSMSGTAPTLGQMEDGYGLFRFGSDYNVSGSEARTNYLIVWDDQVGKFYWLYNSVVGGALNTWQQPSHLDLSSDWGTSEDAVPVFYYVDGALRVSDANYSNTNNTPMWIGNVKRDLFPGSANSTGIHRFSGWAREKQELETPTVGQVSSTAPSNLAGIPDDGVRWRIFNLREQTVQLSDFSDDTSTPGAEDMYFMDEEFGYGGTTSNDESWQTVRNIADGYKDSDAHLYGFGFYDEDDDANNNWSWKTHGDGAFNSGATTFSTGQSLYVAARMTGEEQKQMWLGTHYRPESGDAFLSMSVDNGTIRFLDSGDNESIKFHIDHTRFTDSTTPSGEWHILEFPFDEAYASSVSGGSISIRKLHLELSVSWTRKGDITNVSTRANTHNGEPFIELSDLRVGESGLVGVETVGRQKFLMSYTYDDKENESLLYNFGATEANSSNQEVVLPNSTSSYKIGIEAYIDRLDGASFNKRVTGANLYMEDDGIPYRVAELRYMKGLRGAWESEYPKADQFDEFDTSGNKSSLIKTDGLPLLESYEAMNGFPPRTPTLSSKYKSAVVMNRQVYIGNIFQDSKTYGDRMIKSTTNSFDVFPTEGREIDVVQNDGDEIIKLEAYADRILQFKENVMYLINATRGAEYLEDTFVGKGIVSDSAVCKTDMGIAWVNENGCYFYDGEKVHNLTDSIIDDTDWQTHITDSSDVIYFPLKNKLIVSSGSGHLYEFSFVTKSWSYSKSKLDATKTNFVADIDNDIKYITASGVLKKWDDSRSNGVVRILTKDFDFGNPATRKKCFKFYVTYKCSEDSNVRVYYGTNGIDLTGGTDGTEVAVNSKFAGTDTSCYGSEAGLKTTGDVWKQAELKPSTSINNKYSIQLHFKSESSTTSTFEINDITIVYREKPLK